MGDQIISCNKQDVMNELWRRGELSWLLFEYQLPVYEAVRKAIASKKLKFVMNIARRFGKTSTLILIAIEEALRYPDRLIRFAAPTGKEMEEVCHPIIKMFLKTCPQALVPIWNSKRNCYVFQNGSILSISGVNNKHEDNLRGNNSHLNIVDEAGAIDELKYLVQDVLIPQTTTTNGITVMASTPSVSPDHDFKYYYDEAQVSNTLIEFNIYDNLNLTPDRIEQIKADCGGEASTTWQREYCVKWVTDERLDIIREWDDKYIQDIKPDEYIKFYHKYVCMDLGVVDLTCILYGYYDFRSAKLIVQSEDIINGHDMTTLKVAELVRQTELKLWGDLPVHCRVADNNNLLMLQDLTQIYNLHFRPTNKDNLDAMINQVRLFVDQGRLIVNPSCNQLIGCLRFAIWNKSLGNKRQFARSATYGHFDALASLTYLIRNLDQYTNPIPQNYLIDLQNTHFVPGPNQNSDIEILQRAFKIKRNKR